MWGPLSECHAPKNDDSGGDKPVIDAKGLAASVLSAVTETRMLFAIVYVERQVQEVNKWMSYKQRRQYATFRNVRLFEGIYVVR